jgi:hypothetical protein
LSAHVARFEVAHLEALGVAVAKTLRSIYPEIGDQTELALIHLVIRRDGRTAPAGALLTNDRRLPQLE